MGLALYHKHLITAYFTRSFYKHILGEFWKFYGICYPYNK